MYTLEAGSFIRFWFDLENILFIKKMLQENLRISQQKENTRKLMLFYLFIIIIIIHIIIIPFYF